MLLPGNAEGIFVPVQLSEHIIHHFNKTLEFFVDAAPSSCAEDGAVIKPGKSHLAPWSLHFSGDDGHGK